MLHGVWKIVRSTDYGRCSTTCAAASNFFYQFKTTQEFLFGAILLSTTK